MTLNKEGLEAALLTCPFCGGPASHQHAATDDHRILCQGKNCFGPVTSWYGLADDAVAAWNRRATPALPAPDGLVERLRSRPGEAITRTEHLMDEAATVIQTLQERIDQWEAWAEGLTPAELSNGMNNLKSRAEAAEQQVRDMTAGLERIAAIKYPAINTHYALKATIDYARDQARLLLKEGGE